MEKLLLLDPGKCVGCRQCSLSCSFAKEQLFSLAKARNTVFWLHRAKIFVPMRCQHCEEPLCMAVCPMGAIVRNEINEAVVIDRDRCIGCKMCMVVCPFGAITWDPDNRTMIKCDLCDGDPACADHCLFGALKWLPAREATRIKSPSGAGCLTAV